MEIKLAFHYPVHTSKEKVFLYSFITVVFSLIKRFFKASEALRLYRKKPQN